MGNLLVSLLNSANALSAFNNALATTENNVLNASTPGYAKQTQTLTALPFDLASGLPGGVAAGSVVSSRNAFAEDAVRTQQSQLGYQQQVSNDLQQLQTYFDPASKTNISATMDGFFNSFSQLSVTPNDTVSRQAVLDQAQQVATSFQTAAAGLGNASSAVDDETTTAVAAINRIAGEIAQINTERASNAATQGDAGVDAALNADLEELSQYVGFKALQQPNGAVTVYVGGQTPVVMDGAALPLQADFSTSQTIIRDHQGEDISDQLQGGQLGGLLQVKNTLLPSYMSGLNTLAQSFADQVNTTLSNGVDANGAPPATGLFSYDPTTGPALSLSVNPLTPDQIAAALPTAPGGNGNALAVAQLSDAKLVNGYSFAQFYGSVSGGIGRDLSDANQNATTDQQLLTQAQTLRNQVSGVSLDEEATHLISFQRAYEATSKLVTVLDNLTSTTIDMLSAT